MLGSSLCLAFLFGAASGLDNGAAPTPPRGVTTWELFNYNVSDVELRALADGMVATGLLAAGYDILWLDDGWPACDKLSGGCVTPTPRASDGTIVVDGTKFPNGLASTVAYIHSRGLRAGIYTAPHSVTCGGFSASLNHEAVDAATFASWGIDAVKMDAGCRDDSSLHDGTLIASLDRMRDALNATGRRMVLYVDDGNPTSGPRVVNPNRRGWPTNEFTATHMARGWGELVVSWCATFGNMCKLWFDRRDSFGSLLDNAHQQMNLAWFQAPNTFLAADQMTIGQGGMSAGEERAEVYLYAALATPMFLSASPLRLSAEQLALVTNPEILAVNSDADCTMATLVSPLFGHPRDARDERWAADVWVKPLADSSFVFVAINKDPTTARTVVIYFGDSQRGTGTDIFPAGVGHLARVRDLAARSDLGVFANQTAITIPPHDAAIVRVFPL